MANSTTDETIDDMALTMSNVLSSSDVTGLMQLFFSEEIFVPLVMNCLTTTMEAALFGPRSDTCDADSENIKQGVLYHMFMKHFRTVMRDASTND